MKGIYGIILSVILLFIVSCNKTQQIETIKNVSKTEELITDTNYMEPLIFQDVDVASNIKINFAMGNIKRTLTYQQDDPLTTPSGLVINKGDLKPVWQYIQDRLGFSIEDVAIQTQKASDMISDAEDNDSFDATIYGGNSIADSLMNLGAQGKFINLKNYLKYTPNLTNYLNKNPSIAKAITAYDGGIYHIPYVAEVNNYARVVNIRHDWVTSLLDSTSALIEEDESLTVAYNGFWDRNKYNVITLQNNAAISGTLERDDALRILISYIKDTYPNYSKPSELYIGENALYDMDELVALWRVIKLSPNTLSRVTTGKLVPNTTITPFFLRQSNYNDEVFRLLTFLDGQKVHLVDSTSTGILFEDNYGDLKYSYAEPSFLKKLENIKNWYSEGLIKKDFFNEDDKTNFRTELFFSDENQGQKDFGFMTIDWISSTTASSEKISVILPPVTTISEANINKFIHYFENTRSIKPDGWSISATASEPEIFAALKLFDYIFSNEGSKIQNYSTPDIWIKGQVYYGPDGKAYPQFNNWIVEKAQDLKNGDVNGFLRDYMGSQLPLGYQKEMGLELQVTSEIGMKGWQLYTDKNVLTLTYDSVIQNLKLMPPIISLNVEDIKALNKAKINSSTTDLLYGYIDGTDSSLNDYTDLIQIFKDAGIDEYLRLNQIAYNRMMEPK